MRWQDLRDAANPGTNDVEATASGFDNDSAEGFGEARMEVDVASDHDISNLFMTNGAKKLDSILQNALFEHLLEIYGFRSRTCNDEADVRVRRQDPRNGCDEKIGAFIVEESGDDNDRNGVVRA